MPYRGKRKPIALETSLIKYTDPSRTKYPRGAGHVRPLRGCLEHIRHAASASLRAPVRLERSGRGHRHPSSRRTLPEIHHRQGHPDTCLPRRRGGTPVQRAVVLPGADVSGRPDDHCA